MLSLRFVVLLSFLQGLPPAPTRGLPVVGHSYMLEKDPRCQFKRWREKLGDVSWDQYSKKLMILDNHDDEDDYDGNEKDNRKRCC